MGIGMGAMWIILLVLACVLCCNINKGFCCDVDNDEPEYPVIYNPYSEYVTRLKQVYEFGSRADFN